jgi:hypothetical protein
MQTSRFQLGLIATLAIGLGFSLASSEAVGYPAGAAVSMGSNPIASVGGIVSDGSVDVFTAETGQVAIISDLLLSMNETGCASQIQLVASSGETIAAVKLHSYHQEISTSGTYARAALTNTAPTILSHAFSGGLVVPSGASLSIHEVGGCDVAYTVSGYYAQP